MCACEGSGCKVNRMPPICSSYSVNAQLNTADIFFFIVITIIIGLRVATAGRRPLPCSSDRFFSCSALADSLARSFLLSSLHRVNGWPLFHFRPNQLHIYAWGVSWYPLSHRMVYILLCTCPAQESLIRQLLPTQNWAICFQAINILLNETAVILMALYVTRRCGSCIFMCTAFTSPFRGVQRTRDNALPILTFWLPSKALCSLLGKCRSVTSE